MRFPIICGVGVLLLQGTACTTAKKSPVKGTFVEAKREERAPLKEKPVVVRVPSPLPLPGQLKPVPKGFASVGSGGGSSEGGVAKKPWVVIDDANGKARHQPQEEAFFNAVTQYDFEPGALYQIYTAPMRLTDIQLQPGSKSY